MITNAISFDLEHWHSATLVNREVEKPVDRVEQSVYTILDLLRDHDVTATFFVVGELATDYPHLVRQLVDEGHEVGTHGHVHRPLTDLSPDEFEADLQRSIDAIEDACGVRPRGFRAPNFSVGPRNSWVLQVLDSFDFHYDSSVFPVRTPMYGISDAPVEPYDVAFDAPFREPGTHQTASDLVEFPVATLDLPVRVPIAGGFYARLLPLPVLKYGIRRMNRRGRPANLYFHPWELNPEARIEDLPVHKKFITYHGVEHVEAKLDALFDAFEWDSIERVLAERGTPTRDAGGATETVVASRPDAERE